jgi:putative hydrolase of the HAD superfamily
MPPRIAIFDMDDVLCRYDLGRRLRALSLISGKTPRDIRAAIWDSGFEDDSDAGGYPTGDAYIAAFAQRLGYPISRAQWIAARRESITPWPDALAVAAEIAAANRAAIFTNNGPLMKEALHEIFPEAAGLFGKDIYCSCEFGRKKPDPESYRLLLAHLGIDAREAWFTDDKKSNIEGAVIAGLHGHLFMSAEALRREAIACGLIAA